MWHLVCLIWWRMERSMQLVWRPTYPTIHEIKQFHLSDVPLVWQPKNWTKVFPNDLYWFHLCYIHSSCPYDPLNKIMCFVSFTLKVGTSSNFSNSMLETLRVLRKWCTFSVLKTLRQWWCLFSGLKTLRVVRKQRSPFFSIKNFKSRKAVVEFSLSFKSFKSR